MRTLGMMRTCSKRRAVFGLRHARADLRIHRLANKKMDQPGNDSDAYAAWRNASLLLAKAQSSQRVSASTSARSTVEPHQMRKPDGASR